MIVKKKRVKGLNIWEVLMQKKKSKKGNCEKGMKKRLEERKKEKKKQNKQINWIVKKQIRTIYKEKEMKEGKN